MRAPCLLVPVLLLALTGCPGSKPSGSCTTDAQCGEGGRCCSGQCTDIRSDAANCGACGAACPATNGQASCELSVCQIDCTAGFGNCNNDFRDGCEIDLRVSADDCGVCENACLIPGAVGVCQASTCAMGACKTGFEDCDGAPENGCEANTRGDPDNCGGCGTRCSIPNATARCTGTCQVGPCDVGFQNCDNLVDNGCEVNVASDAKHCGACNSPCTGDDICVGSACKPPVVIGFGGRIDYMLAGPVNKVWRFDVTSKQFEVLTPTAADGAPSARSNATVMWDGPAQRMIVYGGETASADPEVWALTLPESGTPAWSKLASSGGGPGARSSAATGTDSGARKLYVHGGKDAADQPHNDLWVLDLATGVWKQLIGDQSNAGPAANSGGVGAYLPESQRFIVTGVLGGNAQGDGKIYVADLSLATPAWSTVDVSGSQPPGLIESSFIEGTRPLARFGGMNMQFQMSNAVWTLDADTLTWSEETTSGTKPPARFSASATALGNSRVVYGGATMAAGGFGFFEPLDDLWIWRESTKTWEELSAVGNAPGEIGKVGASIVTPK